jgi:hypothetical protein
MKLNPIHNVAGISKNPFTKKFNQKTNRFSGFKNSFKNAVVFIAFLFAALKAHAQVASLGTGTAVNGTTVSSPVNIYYRQCVNQTVYTVAELNAVGISGPKTINQLGYYITQAPAYQIPGYQISIKHTTASNASGSLEGGYTVVKYPFDYTPIAGGWDMIKFDTPFAWNGTQNIVIRTCWSQVQPSYSATGQCRVYTATNGYKYRWSDNTGSACALAPNVTSTNKPQVQFIFDTLTTWTGATSNNWNVSTNWTRGVPNKYIDAKIPAGTANAPLVSTEVVCDELILNGQLTLAVTGSIKIQRHFTSTGTFIDLGGQVVLQGQKTSNLSGTMMIQNLTIETKLGTHYTSGVLTIGNQLSVKESVFYTNDAVILKSDATNTARIDELKNKCTYTLNMNDSFGDGWNGGYLTIKEDGAVLGTFAGDVYNSMETFQVASGSNVELLYTAGSWEEENSFSLINSTSTAMFSQVAPIDTGVIYSFYSSCAFAPMIIGDVSAERYIDAGETYWRSFSSPVQDATIAGYLDDFVTAGFPGSPFPSFSFNSIYTYDETMGPGLGYIPCSGTSQPILPGQGLQVWAGDTITGTTDFTIDLKGQPNQGPINLNVTYTNMGVLEEDGWNLVGNPYASTIDWDSPKWVKGNMSNAVYIQDPDNQQYATYVNGASANGGSRYIASHQSFWVYAESSSPSLVATEGVKTNVDQAFIKNGSGLSIGATIRLSDSNHSDEVVIRDVANATNAYDSDYDAKKMWGGWGLVPQLTLVTTCNTDLTVHSFDFDSEEWIVPMRAVVFSSGTYNLTFQNLDELNVPCLKLEDLYTGIVYDITEGLTLPFMLSDTTWSPRFLLHIGKNYSVKSSPETCHNLNDGYCEIQLDDSTYVNYDLTSSNGTVSGSDLGAPLYLVHLSADIYTVTIPDLVTVCGNNSFTFEIGQPDSLFMDINLNHETFGNDGSIEVTPVGGVPPYQYYWNTGDSTNSIFNLVENAYSLQVIDGNNCAWYQVLFVNSIVGLDQETTSLVTINYIPSENQIRILGLPEGTTQLFSLYAMNGELISQLQPMENNGMTVFDLPSNLANGTYVFASSALKQNLKLVVAR